MEKIDLQASLRETVGNGPARVLRQAGRIPAILYGRNTEPVLLSVDSKELEQVLGKGSFGQLILNIVIQNGKKVTKAAMIKEMQTHPVSGQLIHIDFYEIDMKRQIKVMVPVVTTGKSIGVEEGGMLNIVRRELEVFCLPGDIPESFEIDISEMTIGDSVHIEDIPLGDNVEVAADVNYTVVTVLSPKVEEEEVPEEDEEGLEEGEEGAEGEAADSEAEPEEEK
ncbi:MAG: 50S ribosomal protein L25/general stress protein Ctc [Deltaproteobacteria bacterium]|nr:50S ribosomal protein L25/general stress protein Ctc [Deltaproteobacteria bacterium]